ncbi:MAG TPA: hypothetical protein VER04_28190 [Polyangiaceae bacterium]|nr:hypothetical protein [Polyangiaceae bacterium]
MKTPVEQASSQVGRDNTSEANESSRAFARLLREHAAGFALVKRLSSRSVGLEGDEIEPISIRSTQVLREWSALHAALQEVVQTQTLAVSDGADSSDLAEAMSALEAINPGSPEWGPGLLLVSELVEAESVSSWQQPAESR